MKPKIPPQEYRSILEALDLTSISLIESSLKLKEEYISKSLALDINEKPSFNQDGNTLVILYSYKLSAKNEEQAEPALIISAKYSVKYKISKEIIVSTEFMKIFTDLTVSMLLWTYFREYINNMVYRMGMPPLVLGLKKKLKN
jgi:preprotein translocase subunit SecB